MKPAMIIGILLAVVFLAIGVDYAIPNTTHLFASSAHHYKHALVFGVLAVVALIGARFASNSGSSKAA